ncbi:MAG: hypothetical protein FJZ01_01465 [Candidatus Sericytochromatia bacterium]|nr:hypothetical protein [Candidatus Tanganyikabacteria bacterium]
MSAGVDIFGGDNWRPFLNGQAGGIQEEALDQAAAAIAAHRASSPSATIWDLVSAAAADQQLAASAEAIAALVAAGATGYEMLRCLARCPGRRASLAKRFSEFRQNGFVRGVRMVP